MWSYLKFLWPFWLTKHTSCTCKYNIKVKFGADLHWGLKGWRLLTLQKNYLVQKKCFNGYHEKWKGGRGWKSIYSSLGWEWRFQEWQSQFSKSWGWKEHGRWYGHDGGNGKEASGKVCSMIWLLPCFNSRCDTSKGQGVLTPLNPPLIITLISNSPRGLTCHQTLA